MYVIDGIVYAGNNGKILSVERVVPLKDRMLLVTFDSGETRLFDTTLLSGPVFEPLSDEQIFMHPTIEHGVVTWNNGEIDCAPEYMYKNSFEYTEGEMVSA